MAAVSAKPVPTGTGDFADRVEAAQRALAEGIAKAGLQHDPYRYALESLGMAVGLFPELVQHLEATRQPVQNEEMRRAVAQGIGAHAGNLVQAMNWRNAMLGAAALLGIFVGGAGLGYAFHGAAPVLAGVRAGAERCEDRQDGSRLCWIPVWERLPSR